MAQFKVTSSQMRSSIEELKEMIERYQVIVQKLEESEASLKTMWEGEANDAFHRAFLSDRHKMEDFRRLIIMFIQTLTTITQRYELTEMKNREIATTRTSGVCSC